MGEILDWERRKPFQSGGGGRGPEDPMLEARVAALEVDVAKIRSVLEKLAPRIEEILLTSARRTDLDAARADARVEAEKSRGDMRELSARVAALPTTWTLLSIVFTTWAIGSGIVFAIARFAR